MDLASEFQRHDESTSRSEAHQTPHQTKRGTRQKPRQNKSEAGQNSCRTKRDRGFNIGRIVLVANSVVLLCCVISIIVIAIKLTGLKGDTGETGVPGKQGIKGMKGDKGEKGENGEWIKCKGGWITFDRSCYFIEFKANKTFADAQQDCLSRGASLTKIDNMKENWFLKSLVRERNTGGGVYFGLYDGAKEGKFVWVVDKSTVTFTDWAPGQPDNRNKQGRREDCVYYWESANYQWNDAHCNSTHGYICEIAY